MTDQKNNQDQQRQKGQPMTPGKGEPNQTQKQRQEPNKDTGGKVRE